MADDRNSAGVKRRRLFSPKDDRQLEQLIRENIFTGWKNVAKNMPGFTPKQLRDRWHNYISPRNSLKPWTPDEDKIIIEKVNELGTKWSRIASYLQGRSDNAIKNRWNTVLKDSSQNNQNENTNLTASEELTSEKSQEKEVEEQKERDDEPQSGKIGLLDDRFIERFFDRVST